MSEVKETKEQKEKKLDVKKLDFKSIAIGLLLITSIATNVWLSYSVVTLHNFTMQFVSDVFYYTGASPESGDGTTTTTVPEGTTGTTPNATDSTATTGEDKEDSGIIIDLESATPDSHTDDITEQGQGYHVHSDGTIHYDN